MEATKEAKMPGDACGNYIHMAMQVPIWEHLQRIPQGLRLNLELRTVDGKLYGSTHTPIGVHCHQAAELLMRYEEALRKLARLGNGDLPGNSEGNLIAQAALNPTGESATQRAKEQASI